VGKTFKMASHGVYNDQHSHAPLISARSLCIWRCFLAVQIVLAAVGNSFAGSARMWLSLSSYDPFRYSINQPSSTQPQAPQLDLVSGQTGTLYLWGQPQTANRLADYSSNNQFRQLVDLSLQIDAVGSSASVRGALIANPNDNRFAKVIDSDHKVTLYNQAGQAVLYPLATTQGDLLGVAAYSYQTTAASGIGPTCGAGICIPSQQAPKAPAWLLGSITVLAGHDTSQAQTNLFLQIGSAGISYAGELPPVFPDPPPVPPTDPYLNTSHVSFGADTIPYNAILNRQVTLANDTADAVVTVVDRLAGDFDGNKVVDGTDYVMWRKNPSAGGYSTWRANFGRTTITLPGDFNLDGKVDTADYLVWRKNNGPQEDYNTWRANFGRAPGSSSVGASPTINVGDPVPEPPCKLLVLVAGMVVVGCYRRRASMRPSGLSGWQPSSSLSISFLAVPIILFMTAAYASTAHATLWWDGGASQNWGNPDNWSKDDNQDHPAADNPTPAQYTANNDFVFNISGLSNTAPIILNDPRTADIVRFRSGAGLVTINSDNGSGDFGLTLNGLDIHYDNGQPGGQDPNGVLTGLLVDSNNATINSRVRLGANQQWIANENLIVNGNIELLNRALTIRGGRNTTLNGRILSTAGSITKTGTQTLTITGSQANDSFGSTTVNDGTLVLSKSGGSPANDWGAAVGNLYVNNNDTLVQIAADNQIRDSAVVYATFARVDLGGFSEHAHLLSLNRGTLSGGGNSTWLAGAGYGDAIEAIGPAAVTATNLGISGEIPVHVVDGTLTITSSVSDWTVTGGQGHFRKEGGGTLVLSGAAPNTASGTTTVNAGTLVLSKAQGGAPDNYGAAVGNLDINNNSLVQIANHWQIRDDATVNVNGSRLDVGTGFQELARTLNLNSGTLSGGGGWFAAGVIGNSINSTGSSTISTGYLALGAQTPITVTNGTLTIQSEIRDYGNGGFNKEGGGTLVLTGANTYTGTTTVNGGVLQGTTSTIRGPLSISGAYVNFHQSTIGDFNSSINNGGAVIVSGGGQVNLNGSMTGAGYVELSGGGRLNLNGSSVGWSGPLNVTASTLGGNGSTLGTGRITLNGSELNLSSGAAIANPVTLPMSDSGIQTNGQTVALNGSIDGPGHLAIYGGGRVNLTVANPNWSGGVSVAYSTLGGNGSTLGTGRITLNGSELNLSSGAAIANPVTLPMSDSGIQTNGQTVALNGSIDGPGHLAIYGGGTLTMNGANSFSGGLTVNASTLVANGSNLGSGRLTLDGGYFVTANSGLIQQDITLAGGGGTIDTHGLIPTITGVISGAGDLHKVSGGSLYLDGDNTFTGETRIVAGTLVVDHPNALSKSTVNLAAGETGSLLFQYASTAIIGGLAGSRELSLTRTNSLPLAVSVGNNNSSQVYSGALSGYGSLTKIGSGTLTLNGAGVNTHAGGTVVNNGILALAKQQGDVSSNYGSAAGNVLVGAAGRVRIESYGQIRNDATVTLNGGTLEIIPNAADSVGAIEMNGGQVTGAGILGLMANDRAIGSAGTSTIAVGSIVPQTASGQFNVVVDSDVLTVTSPITAWSGGVERLVKSGAGTLKLTAANTYDGGTTINAGRLAINGSILGPVMVNSGGTLQGSGTVGGNVIGAGRVAPGNSPGILTINGDYTQSSGSSLEIEVGALTPGPGPIGNPNAGHDQVRVGGIATLGGRYEFPIINGFVPVANQEITFIDTFDPDGAGPAPRGSIAAGTRPEDVTAPGLKAAAPGLAFRIISNEGVGGNVKLKFVPNTDIIFDGTSTTANWFTANDWNLNRNPNNEDNTTVGGNVVGTAQRVSVNTVDPLTITPANPLGDPIAKVYQLNVRDDQSAITVGVEAGYKLKSTVGNVTVGDRGAIELNGGVLEVPNTQIVDVNQAGKLAGSGTVTGTVKVGVDLGSNGAMLSPGINPTGMQVGIGTINITGNYQQGPGGVYEVDITGNNSGANNDHLQVTGDLQLGDAITPGGTLRLDVSHLTAFTPGAAYTIATATGATTGEFSHIEVVGRNDLYFVVNYGVPGAGAAPGSGMSAGSATTATGWDRGDATHDTYVDEDDAAVLAAVLVDPKVGSVTGPSVHVPPGDFLANIGLLDAFDFVDTTPGSDIQTIDFFDVPYFIQAMGASLGVSLVEASARFDRALAAAEIRAAVPEPGSLSLIFVALTVFTGCRRGRREA
jgi:autotransporter-associated beta strand protein